MLLVLPSGDVVEREEEAAGEGGFAGVDVPEDDQGKVGAHVIAIVVFANAAVGAERSERGENVWRDFRYWWRLFASAAAAAAVSDGG